MWEIQRCTLQRATGSRRWRFGAEPGWLFQVVSFIMLVILRVSKYSGNVNFLGTKISFDSENSPTHLLLQLAARAQPITSGGRQPPPTTTTDSA